MTEFGTYQGAFAIRRKTFDLKRSKIAMLEFEVVPRDRSGDPGSIPGTTMGGGESSGSGTGPTQPREYN
jgi:hypothetical protein